MTELLQAFAAFLTNRSAPAEPPAPAPPPPIVTILLIDDDPSLLSVLQPALAAVGFRVLTATSGLKGLDLLRYTGLGIELVLLDFHMPRLDGLQTLTYLRKFVPHAKIVGLSGLSLDSVPDGFRTGVDLFLAKPILPSELLRQINDLLGRTTSGASTEHTEHTATA